MIYATLALGTGAAFAVLAINTSNIPASILAIVLIILGIFECLKT